MLEFLLSLDRSAFRFFNSGFTFSLFDSVMPFITDYHKNPFVFSVLILTYFFFLWKGSKQTRTALLLLIPLIIFSDQLNSSLLKNIFERPRPCVSLENVRLLVSCGSGYSFPSSHAVNNFAIATLLSMYFRNYRILFFAFASLVAYSRVYVGVHYPSDIIAGALIGICCAYTLNWTWEKIQTSYFPMLKKE